MHFERNFVKKKKIIKKLRFIPEIFRPVTRNTPIFIIWPYTQHRF